MTIKDEIHAYLGAYRSMTGRFPGGVPVTVNELEEFESHMFRECPMRKMTPSQDGLELAEPVISYYGADLFVTPDAKERRDALVAL